MPKTSNNSWLVNRTLIVEGSIEQRLEYAKELETQLATYENLRALLSESELLHEARMTLEEWQQLANLPGGGYDGTLKARTTHVISSLLATTKALDQLDQEKP
jgi:hypothetical protein